MDNKFTIKNFDKLAPLFEEKEGGNWIVAETETQYTLIGDTGSSRGSVVIHRDCNILYNPITFTPTYKIKVDVSLNGNTHRNSWDRDSFQSPEGVWGMWKIGLDEIYNIRK